jgi:hypothetical protein
MTPLEAALVEISTALDRLQVPHMLVGGLAVSLWGEPRATLDVDLVLWVEPEDLPSVVTQLAKEFHPLPASPVAFVAQTRVLPVSTAQGVRADLIFAELPYERKAIGRSQQKQVGDRMVAVASLEDLLLSKLVSGRSRDLDDVSRILRRFRHQIDYAYLEPRLRELADALGRSEIIDLFQHESGRD